VGSDVATAAGRAGAVVGAGGAGGRTKAVTIDGIQYRRVWVEDDALIISRDPDRETLETAWTALYGEPWDRAKAIKQNDRGDHTLYHMPNGAVAYYGYDGGAIYEPAKGKVP
jgi:hypothetical protein